MTSPIYFEKTEAKSIFELPKKGPYFAKIASAEVRTPQDLAKSPYLNISYEIFNERKEKKGFIFDMLSTSEHPFCQQRIGRFVTAIGLHGKSFGSYADICKIAIGRELGFFITEDTSDYVKQNPGKERMIVDTRNDGIYYTVEEIRGQMPPVNPQQMTEITGKITTSVAEESAPFSLDEDF